MKHATSSGSVPIAHRGGASGHFRSVRSEQPSRRRRPLLNAADAARGASAGPSWSRSYTPAFRSSPPGEVHGLAVERGRLVVPQCGLDFVVEVADLDTLAIDHNLCDPLVPGAHPVTPTYLLGSGCCCCCCCCCCYCCCCYCPKRKTKRDAAKIGTTKKRMPTRTSKRALARSRMRTKLCPADACFLATDPRRGMPRWPSSKSRLPLPNRRPGKEARAESTPLRAPHGEAIDGVASPSSQLTSSSSSSSSSSLLSSSSS